MKKHVEKKKAHPQYFFMNCLVTMYLKVSIGDYRIFASFIKDLSFSESSTLHCNYFCENQESSVQNGKQVTSCASGIQVE